MSAFVYAWTFEVIVIMIAGPGGRIDVSPKIIYTTCNAVVTEWERIAGGNKHGCRDEIYAEVTDALHAVCDVV